MAKLILLLLQLPHLLVVRVVADVEVMGNTFVEGMDAEEQVAEVEDVVEADDTIILLS